MVVGLTGGIGSGKSIVTKMFEILGCATFNSDEVARDTYFDPEIKAQVVNLLGVSAYLSERSINKTYIGSLIFDDSQTLKKLNAIIHPAVGRKFDVFKAENSHKIIIKETALLFEANLQHQVDKIIVVVSNDHERIKRVMERDGLNQDEVLKKMKNQLPQTDKASKADFVINNNEEEFLITQVLKIYKELHVA